MAEKKKRKTKAIYKKHHPAQFLKLCQEGKLLAEIADEMGVLEEDLLLWGEQTEKDSNNSARKWEWKAVWKKGLQAMHAFHIRLYKRMIAENAPAAALKEQQYILKTQFSKHWMEKPKEIKIDKTIREEEMLSTDDLKKQVMAKAKKAIKTIKPDLKLVEGGKGD